MIGSEKKALAHELTTDDKRLLKSEIKKELGLYREVVEQSPDLRKGQGSILMDPRLIDLKNDIQKKVKLFKKKKHDLPEFVRHKRIEIIDRRLTEERR